MVDDALDAPRGTFTHWPLWNVPPNVTTIPEGIATTEVVDTPDGACQGTNDAGGLRYLGPCPPTGDSAHTYRFTRYVLDQLLVLESSTRRAAVLDALARQTVVTSRFTGEFGR